MFHLNLNGVAKHSPPEKLGLRLEVFPVAYVGNLNEAKIVLLCLNPGFIQEDIVLQKLKVLLSFNKCKAYLTNTNLSLRIMSNLLDSLYFMREHFINKVLELRKELEVTQEDLAKAVSVSRQTIIAIEKGNYIPSLLLGIKIARFFKKPIDQVFEYKYEK